MESPDLKKRRSKKVGNLVATGLVVAAVGIISSLIMDPRFHQGMDLYSRPMSGCKLGPFSVKGRCNSCGFQIRPACFSADPHLQMIGRQNFSFGFELMEVGFGISSLQWRNMWINDLGVDIFLPWGSLVALIFSPWIFRMFNYWDEQRGKAKVRSIGMCVKCGYDLRATPNRCPECGTTAELPNLSLDLGKQLNRFG